MLAINTNEINEESMQRNKNMRKKYVNMLTTQVSPSRITSYYISRTNSSNRPRVRTETGTTVDPTKKTIHELRYFLQIKKIKTRNALISKNFEESNLSPKLTHSPNHKGLKGFKLQNRKNYRKHRYIDIDEIGCIEPSESREISNTGLVARYNKPNLMYNLDLFRKKNTQKWSSSGKRGIANSFTVKQMPKTASYQYNKIRSSKTQQDERKPITLRERSQGQNL